MQAKDKEEKDKETAKKDVPDDKPADIPVAKPDPVVEPSKGIRI